MARCCWVASRSAQEIERALARAHARREHHARARREPGIGKTALLDDAVARASGMRLLRARGIESEAQIPFASLLELLRPALSLLDAIPQPQAVALEGALALRPGARAGALRDRRRHAEPARRLRRAGPGRGRDRRRALARRLQRAGAAVRVPAARGRPDRGPARGARGRVVAARRRRPADAADRRPQQRRRGDAPARAGARRGRCGCTARPAGNPLALLELESDAHELAFAPEGAPVLIPARIARAFLRRVGLLDEPPSARSCSPRPATAATCRCSSARPPGSGIDLAALAGAESAGPRRRCAPARSSSATRSARSAIYADAPAAQRRAAHRALAAALPDRDVDRRAWHLAAAAVGADEAASAALAQAGARSRERSAYATAAAAFERAGRLAADPERRALLLWEAADTAWLAGLGRPRRRAARRGARQPRGDEARLVEIDELAGHIATRRGPVMRGHAILSAAAERAEPERAGGDAHRGGRRLLLRGRPGRDAGGRRARAGGAARRPLAARPLPGRHRVGMAQILGGTPRPVRSPCTRRSRSPRARPSCATTSSSSRGWRSGRSSCARPAPAARCSSTRWPPRGRAPRSARCRSCST